MGRRLPRLGAGHRAGRTEPEDGPYPGTRAGTATAARATTRAAPGRPPPAGPGPPSQRDVGPAAERDRDRRPMHGPHPRAYGSPMAHTTFSTTSAPGFVPHPEGVSDDEFRAAMARLPAGVVLVTAHDPEDGPDGADAGMTATAFMSVSLDPHLVLVSVREGSRMDELLERVPLWAVSVLAEDQRQTAGRFAMKGRLSDRLLFQDVGHHRGEASGAPLIDGALAHVECRTEQRVPAGDHTLVIGRVLTARAPSASAGPLTYYKGRYRGLA